MHVRHTQLQKRRATAQFTFTLRITFSLVDASMGGYLLVGDFQTRAQLGAYKQRQLFFTCADIAPRRPILGVTGKAFGTRKHYSELAQHDAYAQREPRR